MTLEMSDILCVRALLVATACLVPHLLPTIFHRNGFRGGTWGPEESRHA